VVKELWDTCWSCQKLKICFSWFYKSNFDWIDLFFSNSRDKLKIIFDKAINCMCADDAELFSEMLTQRPIRALNTVISAKELEYMAEMARQRFDKITHVLRAMPNVMMLVIRYTLSSLANGLIIYFLIHVEIFLFQYLYKLFLKRVFIDPIRQIIKICGKLVLFITF